MQLTKKHQLIITVVVTILIWGHIAWDHFHGGIPVHYLLHDPNLPGIPNWVGGVLLPFFTWFLVHRIQKRVNQKNSQETLKKVSLRLLASAIVAITISICFMFQIDVIDYIMLLILVLAFIFPFYRSEYLLGWVWGSAFSFGAFIPIVFGSVLALLCYLLFVIGRFAYKLLKPKRD